MTECPPIATYKFSSGPRVVEWLARYVVTKHLKSGLSYYQFLPMIFMGASEIDAKGQATQFWASEQAKIEARRGNLDKANAARRKST